MKIIENQWKDCLEKKIMLFVAITGIGGTGKSEMARNYAKHFYENVQGHCIWLDAETNQSLSQSLSNLAKNVLDIQLHDLEEKEKSQNDLVAEIYEKFRNKKCLIILDNIIQSHENPILGFLAELASKQADNILRPFVVITSRFPLPKRVLGTKCFHVEVKTLERDAGVDFFAKSFGLIENSLNSIDEKFTVAAGKLCQRLEYFPLAMEHAAAYIKENISSRNPKISSIREEIDEYLKKIEKEAKLLLDHKIPQQDSLDNISNTAYLTWKIAINKIRRRDHLGCGRGATKMMNFISFLSPDDISINFLTRIMNYTRSTNRKRFSKVFQRCFQEKIATEVDIDVDLDFYQYGLELLNNHSMITLAKDKSSLNVHRLVQEVTRIELEERKETIKILGKLLNILENLMEEVILPEHLNHIEAIWRYVLKIPSLLKKHHSFPILINSKFIGFGRYRDAYQFSCQALDILEVPLGHRHRSVLRLCSFKGYALMELGNYEEALSLLRQVYEDQKNIFAEKEEDDEILQTSSLVAMVYMKLNIHDESIKWFEKTLKTREKLNGKEHTETIHLRNNIAVVFAQQGKYTEAYTIYKELVKVKERVFGLESPFTVTSKHNFACVLNKQEKYEDALKIFKEVVKIREKLLREDHPETLLSKYWLASTFKELRMYTEASELAKEVYDKRIANLGPQHPNPNAKISEKLVKELEILQNNINVSHPIVCR